MNACFALGGFLTQLFALKFKHYKDFVCLYCISLSVVSIGYFYFLPSPYHLYRKKRLVQLYECVQTICKRNYSKEELVQKQHEIDQYFTQNILSQTSESDSIVKDKNQVFSLLETQIKHQEILISQSVDFQEQSFRSSVVDFCSKKNLAMFCKLTFLFVLVDLVFGLSILINKDLGISNIYLSGMMVTSFQIVGYIPATLVISKFGRRTINIFITSLVSVASLTIFVIDLVSKRHSPYSERSQAVRIAETGKRD